MKNVSVLFNISDVSLISCIFTFFNRIEVLKSLLPHVSTKMMFLVGQKKKKGEYFFT